MKVVIVGVGNRLMGDDGFGSCLAEIIKDYILGAEVLDLGTSNLLNIDINKYDIVVLLDIANIDSEYGIYEVKRGSDYDFSLHDLGLNLVLKLYEDKKFYVVACKPYIVDINFRLSEECINRLVKLFPIFKLFMEKFGVKINLEVSDITKLVKEKCVNILEDK